MGDVVLPALVKGRGFICGVLGAITKSGTITPGSPAGLPRLLAHLEREEHFDLVAHIGVVLLPALWPAHLGRLHVLQDYREDNMSERGKWVCCRRRGLASRTSKAVHREPLKLFQGDLILGRQVVELQLVRVAGEVARAILLTAPGARLQTEPAAGMTGKHGVRPAPGPARPALRGGSFECASPSSSLGAGSRDGAVTVNKKERERECVCVWERERGVESGRNGHFVWKFSKKKHSKLTIFC